MSTVHIYFSVRSKMESKRNTTYFFKNSTMEGEKARGNFVKRDLHKKKTGARGQSFLTALNIRTYQVCGWLKVFMARFPGIKAWGRKSIYPGLPGLVSIKNWDRFQVAPCCCQGWFGGIGG
jgi:hypothetical protein